METEDRSAESRFRSGHATACQSPGHECWPVDADPRDLSDAQRSRLTGPNQIADMQLLLLAHRRRGQLATFDAGLRELASGTRYANSLLILQGPRYRPESRFHDTPV